MKQIAYVLIGLMFGFLLAGVLFWVTNIQQGATIGLEASPTKLPIEVHVIGGVVRPGVYTLPEGSRVEDAINAAGGMLEGTDSNSINLAAKLEDGQQLEIPSTEITSEKPINVIPFSVISTPGDGSSTSELININTASLSLLDTLPGIGPTTAQKIIDYRNNHGPFNNIEDILNVSGIGPATFDRIQDLITTD
jgi:competence protein ComEA